MLLDESFEGVNHFPLIGMTSVYPASDPVPLGFINNPILKNIKMIRI